MSRKSPPARSASKRKVPPRRTAFDRCRDDLLRALDPLGGLADRPWAEIAHLEIMPGLTLGARYCDVPEGVLPPGPGRLICNRRLDPSLDGLLRRSDKPEGARLEEAVRRCLLVLWLPRKTSRAYEANKPSTWILYSRMLFRMAAWTIKAFPSQDGTLFSHLSPEQVGAVLSHFVDPNRSATLQYDRIFRYLETAGAKGILADFPARTHTGQRQDAGRGLAETDWKGVEITGPQIRPEPRKYQPFPDGFVSALIGRALWVHRNLADQVISVWADVRRRADGNEVDPAIYREIVGSHPWRDADGQRVTQLPFDIFHYGRATRVWPPESPEGLDRFVEIVQGLNIHLVAFCTGARRAEITSATDGSVKDRADGNMDFEARTYKLVPTVGGEVRDWPLHPAGAAALRFQAKLAALVRPTDMECLWFSQVKGERLWKAAPNLSTYGIQTVRRLGLKDMAVSDEARRIVQQSPEGSRLEWAHLHRWRVTVARIVALTTVGAPQILLDLFGHRDVGMTLGYMLADRKIVDDARVVAQERTAIMAEDALVDVERGCSSGPATRRLRARMARFDIANGEGSASTAEAMQDGQRRYGQSKLGVMARVFTLQGKFWRLVRPGVICTKLPGQFGPCTQGWGAPDAGNCRTGCGYRLETAAAKSQCRAALDALLVEHEAARSRGMLMVVANLEEQIRENLRRWDDVRDEVLSRSLAAMEIWQDAVA